MYDLKTKLTDKSVIQYINNNNMGREKDAEIILSLMKKVTNEEPRMWGDSIVGYGLLAYKYASGHQAEFLKVGFSLRKQYITIYLPMYIEANDELFSKLGKFKNGKGCLYIKKIDDINIDVLETIIIKGYSK